MEWERLRNRAAEHPGVNGSVSSGTTMARRIARRAHHPSGALFSGIARAAAQPSHRADSPQDTREARAADNRESEFRDGGAELRPRCCPRKADYVNAMRADERQGEIRHQNLGRRSAQVAKRLSDLKLRPRPFYRGRIDSLR